MDTNKPSTEPTPTATAPSSVVETPSGASVAQATTLPRPAQPSALNKPTERSEVKTPRIIASDATMPGQKLPVVTLDMTKPVDTALDIDKDTVVYLIYLLFKTNMIARNNLRNMIDQISKPLPDDVLKWLVNEAAKAGR